MQAYQDDREVSRILRVADGSLREDDTEQQHCPSYQRCRRARRLDRDEQPDRQAEQEEDEIGVHLGDRSQVEREPVGCILVAGVRAGAGDHRSGEQRRSDDREQGSTAEPQRTEYDGCCPDGGRKLVGAHGDGDQRHREQEVRHHGHRVEPGHDGDRSQQRLRDDAREEQARRCQQVAAARAPGGDQGGGDGCGQHERQHPVAELDHPVRAHLPGRHQAGVGALGHVGAAEARSGKAHRTPGHHDADVGHQCAEEGTPHSGGGRPPLPQPGQAVAHVVQPTSRPLPPWPRLEPPPGERSWPATAATARPRRAAGLPQRRSRWSGWSARSAAAAGGCR